jgi:hypothetical protein
LASEIGLTRSKTQSLIDSRPKKLVVAREKIRFIREAAVRAFRAGSIFSFGNTHVELELGVF